MSTTQPIRETAALPDRPGAAPNDTRHRFDASMEQWFPSIYDCLRDLAERFFRYERIGHTFEPTVLVHEAYVRLAKRDGRSWQNPTHLMAVAARTIREVLVDHARRKATVRRGGGCDRVPLEAAEAQIVDRPFDFLALDEALTRLATHHERASRVVELRYFSGMTIEETAEALGVSVGTVKLDWRFARAWLHRELDGDAV